MSRASGLPKHAKHTPAHSVIECSPEAFLGSHRAHDYRHLIRRWRKVARAARLTMTSFASASGFEVFVVKTKNLPAAGAIYISAGIHGDEPAGTEALVTWAEKNGELLRRVPFVLLPCLNPWGLVNNSRNDEERRDMNRAFHHDEIDTVRELRRMLAGHRFPLALMLHEDYDGQGLYIYEVRGTRPYWGEDLLELARPIIASEGRTRIEGRRFKNGVFRRKIDLGWFNKIGFPEAVYLHANHCERTFTIETPSEFSLDLRVRAHIAVLEECVRRTLSS